MENRISFYDQDLVTHHDPLSQISEAFKITRTNIEFSSIDRELKTIAITSSNQAEGKTITIANLAITYAQIGRKVLLIDADLRRPAVHRLFGLTNRRGLTNVLLSSLPMQDYIQPTLTANLAVLTSGPVPPNPAELLMSAAMARLIESARQEYDLVLFDCPPVGAVTDAAIVATKVDGTLYVVRAGKVNRKQLQRASALLKQVKAHVLGYILNGITQDTDDYYYYYYQQYYYTSDGTSKATGRGHNKKHRRSRQEPSSFQAKRTGRENVRQNPVRMTTIPQLHQNPVFSDDPETDIEAATHAPIGHEAAKSDRSEKRGLQSEDD